MLSFSIFCTISSRLGGGAGWASGVEGCASALACVTTASLKIGFFHSAVAIRTVSTLRVMAIINPTIMATTCIRRRYASLRLSIESLNQLSTRALASATACSVSSFFSSIPIRSVSRVAANLLRCARSLSSGVTLIASTFFFNLSNVLFTLPTLAFEFSTCSKRTRANLSAGMAPGFRVPLLVHKPFIKGCS